MDTLFKKKLLALEDSKSSDIHGHQIPVAGMGLDSFRQNPLVVIGQDMQPVGRAEVEVDEKGLWARVLLSKNLMTVPIYDKLLAGLLDGSQVLTIGFQVLEYEEKGDYRILTKTDLAFLLIVSKAAKEASMDTKDTRPPVERTEQESEAPEVREDQKAMGRHNRGILSPPQRGKVIDTNRKKKQTRIHRGNR